MQTQTINLSIPKPLLTMISQQAKTEARTRSGLIQEAIRTYLTQKNAWKDLFNYGEKAAKKSKLKADRVEKIVDDYRQGR